MISNFKFLASVIRNTFYRTFRIYFSPYTSLKIELRINICLHQVGDIKRDSLDNSTKLGKGERSTAWMSTLVYVIIIL